MRRGSGSGAGQAGSRDRPPTRPAPHNAVMQSTRIVWRRLDVPGVEWCEVAATDDGIAIDGLALVDWEGVAHRVEYRVELDDAARTRRVSVRDRARRGRGRADPRGRRPWHVAPGR
jgi:hypothetical protein